MKMTAMAAEFSRQLNDSSFNVQQVTMLMTAEWNWRQIAKVDRLIKKTHFSAPSATAEGIEYYEDCKQDKAQMLYLATIHIDEGHYVILENA